MSGPPERRTADRRPRPWGRSAACAILALSLAPGVGAQDRGDRRRDRLDEANRREGAALVALVDSATAGHPASDFALDWRNDFFKAQVGTFVPFTVTVAGAKLSASSALMYVRATRRDASPTGTGARDSQTPYPFDAIFPVELEAGGAGPIRITRGFAVPPGEYDVYVALRERPADPLGPGPRLKSAVLKQPLVVPDFWGAGLCASTVMLADRIDPVPEGVGPDDVLERPYVIGENEIHPAAGSSFRKDRELIVVFLIYNPTVSDKNFDVEVEYHLFRSLAPGAVDPGPVEEGRSGDHPAPRAGERYVTHTAPQRFKPSLMGPQFDPEAGRPMMAGQGILLSSFDEGEYRLGITVTDLLSRRTLSRDVTFTVVGS
jgi:hypothetical protein